MSKCVIGHDYALVYELEIMPINAFSLGTQWENKKLDETGKWFMDEEKVGQNRPLMHDFIELAKKNEEAKLSICFLVSLSQMKTKTNRITDNEFRLKLLKNGKPIMDNFKAPPKVYEVEELKGKVGINDAELTIKHGTATPLDDFKTAYYQMKVTYESIKTDVCECHNMIYPLVYRPTLDNKLPYYL